MLTLQVDSILKSRGFHMSSRSGDGMWRAYSNSDRVLITVDLEAKQVQVSANVAGCITIQYQPLALHFLLEETEALNKAIARIAYLLTSYEVEELNKEYLAHMLNR